jgi:hypothetical protein
VTGAFGTEPEEGRPGRADGPDRDPVTNGSEADDESYDLGSWDALWPLEWPADTVRVPAPNPSRVVVVVLFCIAALLVVLFLAGRLADIVV